ncbi:hypothetical protein [Streptomyces chartreusis]|uniref:hypothetical protein n=1 Tax=Streptomyces chartreusis TaxID=1969 RepID=UPI0038225DD9
MSDRLEWAHTTSYGELLYPGVDIDGAVVEPGEIAVAVWTGSNGIALHGPKQELHDRLLQLAAAVHEAPPVPEAEACIAESVDAATWKPDHPLDRALAPLPGAPALCGTGVRPVAPDPRLATCPECIDVFNSSAPRVSLGLYHPVPALS